MPKNFSRRNYLKKTKFVHGINPELAADEAEEIFRKGKDALIKKRRASRRKSKIKEKK